MACGILHLPRIGPLFVFGLCNKCCHARPLYGPLNFWLIIMAGKTYPWPSAKNDLSFVSSRSYVRLSPSFTYIFFSLLFSLSASLWLSLLLSFLCPSLHLCLCFWNIEQLYFVSISTFCFYPSFYLYFFLSLSLILSPLIFLSFLCLSLCRLGFFLLLSDSHWQICLSVCGTWHVACGIRAISISTFARLDITSISSSFFLSLPLSVFDAEQIRIPFSFAFVLSINRISLAN